MVKLMFWRSDPGTDAAIQAEKMLSQASVESVKNATSRLQTVLDQMRETNEERRNARYD